MKQINRFFIKGKKSALVIIIAISVILSAGFVNKNFELTKNLDIFATLYRELAINYVDEINPAELIDTAIDNMLETLDPYTVYIPESEIEDARFMTTGEYGGIGALIHYRGKTVVISEPYEGFPADKAGLVAGDEVLEVNGVSAKNMSLDDVRTMLHGQPDSEVDLLIKRYGADEPIKKTLKREIIQVTNVPYYGMLNDNYGYIKLSGFTQSASSEFRDAFKNLGDSNKLKGLVIDLRGNGGGLLNEAVDITNFFIDKDNIVVETKGRLAERNTTHKTLNNPIDTVIPLTVLIDRRSASAAEIVAGALQDFDRAVLVGERTFGKGLVQNIVPLAYNTQMKVTIAKYYIPSGRCIQAIDYAKRNDDGSVAKIPDSLKVAFETKNGRTVYDGGGVEPDISTELFSPKSITYELMTQYMVFDFATRFFHQNNQIPDPVSFMITDNIYEDFVSFVNDNDFEFNSSTEMHLQAILEAAKEDSYYELITEDIEDLEKKIDKIKENDIYDNSEEIKRLLKLEIVNRYYYAEGRIKAALEDDETVFEAIKVLDDDKRYQSILSLSK